MQLACFAIVVLLAACAPKAIKGPFLLHPVPPRAEGYALTQGALVFDGGEFAVSARPWDWRLVEEEFRGAGAPNPFGTKEGETARFVFFRVRIENRSAKRLVVNPLRASLLRKGETPVVPLENSDLFAFAAEGEDVEGRGRSFRRVSFDGTVTLRPGESIERYLVFPSPEEAKLITLELDDLWLGSESFAPRFQFEAFPGR